ncbi:hypothetical protein OF377_02085 [Ureaplasma sp. ES3154-GEN]|uniref:hypothetical protein n=1 Tax=Ureaplasma sp. ES3154-GEN TaxID=2984844 RepID=UPI0021E8C3E2|nr:hypothetical protein [Ureaplasma sp. ES3154-GEN]MCV3743659.1 hypothetical protein [Ureaplasma sp. ES3154-GEN]
MKLKKHFWKVTLASISIIGFLTAISAACVYKKQPNEPIEIPEINNPNQPSQKIEDKVGPKKQDNSKVQPEQIKPKLEEKQQPKSQPQTPNDNNVTSPENNSVAKPEETTPDKPQTPNNDKEKDVTSPENNSVAKPEEVTPNKPQSQPENVEMIMVNNLNQLISANNQVTISFDLSAPLKNPSTFILSVGNEKYSVDKGVGSTNVEFILTGLFFDQTYTITGLKTSTQIIDISQLPNKEFSIPTPELALVRLLTDNIQPRSATVNVAFNQILPAGNLLLTYQKENTDKLLSKNYQFSNSLTQYEFLLNELQPSNNYEIKSLSFTNETTKETKNFDLKPFTTHFTTAKEQLSFTFNSKQLEYDETQEKYTLWFATNPNNVSLYTRISLVDVNQPNNVVQSEINLLTNKFVSFRGLENNKQYKIQQIDLFADAQGINYAGASTVFDNESVFNTTQSIPNDQATLNPTYSAFNDNYNPVEPVLQNTTINKIANELTKAAIQTQHTNQNNYFEEVDQVIVKPKVSTYAQLIKNQDNEKIYFIANAMHKNFTLQINDQIIAPSSKNYNQYVFNILDSSALTEQRVTLLDENNISVPIYQKATNPISITKNSVTDNVLTVTFNQNINENQELKIMVKGLDVTNPFYTILTAQSKMNNQATFNIDNLPKDQLDFVITNVFLDQDVSVIPDYNNQNHRFKSHVLTELSLEHFDFFSHQIDKTVYGSAFFNFQQQDLKYYKNMVFDFVFKHHADNLNTQYVFNFNPIKKVSVPFDELWKFNLNTFAEFNKYELQAIRVVTKNSAVLINTVNLGSFLNKQFSYHFNYETHNQNDFSLNGLNNNDLTSDDVYDRFKLRDEWKTRNQYTSNKTLKFATNNMWAIAQHLLDKRKLFTEYKDNDRNSYFYKIEKPDQSVAPLMLYAPRELIKNKVFAINNDSHEAIITKGLKRFENLNELDPAQTILFFKFELELHDRINWDFFDARKKNTEIVVPVSYDYLLNHNHLENLNFYFYQLFTTQAVQEHVYNQMRDQFNFIVDFNPSTKELTFKIKAKNNDYQFTSLVYEHTTSSQRSVLVSPTIFGIMHTNETLKLLYNEEKLDQLTQIQPDLSVYNIDLPLQPYHDFRETPFIKRPDLPLKSAKRLFKEDQTNAIVNARKRAFKATIGTWNLLGKVKPEDPNDNRYWVTTNDHVGGNAHNRDITRMGLIGEIMVPKIIDKDPNNPHPTSPHRAEDDFYKWAYADFNLVYNEVYNYSRMNQIVDNEGNEIHTSHANFDMTIGTIDLSDLLRRYGDGNTEWYRNLSEPHKQVVQFFLEWKNLPFTKLSPDAKLLADNSALNWYIASFPADLTDNQDSVSGSRYREYLLMYSSVFMNAGGYLPQYLTTKVAFDRYATDLAGGASGTMIYDYLGNAIGLVTEGHTTEYGPISFHLFDGQVRSIYGSKEDKKNPESFYWRIKRNAFLNPENYTDVFNDE